MLFYRKELEELKLLLQSTLSYALACLKKIGLFLNIERATTLGVTLNTGSFMDNKKVVELISLFIDVNMSWGNHIGDICSRLSRVICL